MAAARLIVVLSVVLSGCNEALDRTAPGTFVTEVCRGLQRFAEEVGPASRLSQERFDNATSTKEKIDAEGTWVEAVRQAEIRLQTRVEELGTPAIPRGWEVALFLRERFREGRERLEDAADKVGEPAAKLRGEDVAIAQAARLTTREIEEVISIAFYVSRVPALAPYYVEATTCPPRFLLER